MFTFTFEEWIERIKDGNIFVEYGTVQFTDDGSKIICPFCGKEYISLSAAHLRTHGLDNTDQVRELMGLNRTQQLCSPELSARHSRRSLRLNSIQHVEKYQGLVDISKIRRPYREQHNIELKVRVIERRRLNQPVRGAKTKRSNARKVDPSGQFYVLGKGYSFSRAHGGKIVIFALTDTEIFATLEKDVNVSRTYKRKDIEVG